MYSALIGGVDAPRVPGRHWPLSDELKQPFPMVIVSDDQCPSDDE